MPDVWTTNPEKLRNALEFAGAVCGGEARVLKPRDKDWTCYIDGGGYIRDIYIHHWSDFLFSNPFTSSLMLVLSLGLLVGYMTGKRLSARKQ
jgi:hypothetical protein